MSNCANFSLLRYRYHKYHEVSVIPGHIVQTWHISPLSENEQDPRRARRSASPQGCRLNRLLNSSNRACRVFGRCDACPSGGTNIRLDIPWTLPGRPQMLDVVISRELPMSPDVTGSAWISRLIDRCDAVAFQEDSEFPGMGHLHAG